MPARQFCLPEQHLFLFPFLISHFFFFFSIVHSFRLLIAHSYAALEFAGIQAHIQFGDFIDSKHKQGFLEYVYTPLTQVFV